MRAGSRPLLRFVYVLALALLVVYILSYALKSPWIEFFELKFADLMYRIRGVMKIDPHVIVVGIDEKSLTHMEAEGDYWPWSRHHYGKVVKNLFKAGVKAVLIDVSFTNPDEKKPNVYDAYFASILFRNRRVVLGTYLINSKKTYEEYPESLKREIESNTYYLDYVYKMRNFSSVDLISPLVVYKVRPPIKRFSSIVPSASYEIGELDVDGVARNLVLFFKEKWAEETGKSSGFLPHMDVLGFALYLGKNDNEALKMAKSIVVDFDSMVIEVGDRKIPFDSRGYFHLYYYGPGKEIFKEISFVDVENWNGLDPKLFKDKVAIIGFTATAKGLYDLRVTPFSNNEPGVFIHATALENMIRGDSIARLPISVRFAFIVAVLSLSLVFLKSERVSMNVITFLIVPVIFAISYQLFLNKILLDSFYASFSTLVLASFGVGSNLYKEHTEKKKMREFLYRYVPDTVADYLMRKGRLELGGEKRNVVVLFSDLKGFTSLSEGKDPKEIVDMLNDYFTRMGKVIRDRYEGTIDKFIGDAIMAIFGAPIEKGDEIDRALMCALDMMKELEKLNEEKGYNLKFGIGMHYGEVIVGNVGTPTRMDYTCIGDTVNTASRIEHLTREVGLGILVSETMKDSASEDFIFEYVGEYVLRGKTGKMKIYRLVGRRSRGEVGDTRKAKS